jgi:hypothetical protein
MMTLLTEFGVQSRIEDEDYIEGLAAIRKAWRPESLRLCAVSVRCVRACWTLKMLCSSLTAL